MAYVPIQTGRDPFARHSIRKERDHRDCAFCGRPGPKNWRYLVDPDSGRAGPIVDRAFCGIDCLNAFIR